MNSVQRVFKNTAAEVGGQGVNFIVTLVYSIFLVRLMGPEQYGKYSLSFNFASFFGVFVAYGFGWLITDRVARDQSRAGVYLGNVLPLQIVLGMTTLAVMTLIAVILKYPADTTLAIVICGGGMLALQMYVTVYSIFRAFERLEIHSLIIVSLRIVSAFLGCLLLFAGYRLIPLVSLTTILTIGQVGVGFLIVRKIIGSFHWKADLPFWRKMMIESFPFAIAGFFMALRLNFGALILSKIGTESDIGFFNAAFRPVSMVSWIALSFANALYPVMSRSGSSKAKLLDIYTFATKSVLLFSLPIAIEVMLMSGWLVPLAYGPQFEPAIRVLQILIWILPSMFFVYPMGNVLVAIGKTHLVSISLAINGGILILLNVLFIRRFSYIGTAWAAVVGEAVLAVLYFFFISRHLGKLPLVSVIVKPALAAFLMAVASFFLRSVSLPVAVIVGAFVYIIAVVLLRIFSVQDLDKLRELTKTGWLKSLSKSNSSARKTGE